MIAARLMKPCKPGCSICKSFIAKAKATEAKFAIAGAKDAARTLKSKCATQAAGVESVERLAHAVVKARNASNALRKATAVKAAPRKPATAPPPKKAVVWPADMGDGPLNSWKGMAAELEQLRATNSKLAAELKSRKSIHANRCVNEFERFASRFAGARKALSKTKAIRALVDARNHVKRHAEIARSRSNDRG